jgi:hypothetical protein
VLGHFQRRYCYDRFYGIGRLVRAACRFWKLPIFIYAGVNKDLPTLPGFGVPSRLRSPMLVQTRNIVSDEPDVAFDRFQLIDADFA